MGVAAAVAGVFAHPVAARAKPTTAAKAQASARAEHAAGESSPEDLLEALRSARRSQRQRKKQRRRARQAARTAESMEVHKAAGTPGAEGDLQPAASAAKRAKLQPVCDEVPKAESSVHDALADVTVTAGQSSASMHAEALPEPGGQHGLPLTHFEIHSGAPSLRDGTESVVSGATRQSALPALAEHASTPPAPADDGFQVAVPGRRRQRRSRSKRSGGGGR
jgi:hypothetical protein